MNKFDDERYREIEKARVSLSKIIADIQRTGFKIGTTYRVFENPYHRFFILRKGE